jgi:hypothetical protein
MSVVPCARRGRHHHEQERDEREQPTWPGTPASTRGDARVRQLCGQIGHEHAQLAERLGLVAALKPLLELVEIEPAIGMPGPKLVGDLFTVRVGGA